jgi:hypothetical protein
MEMKETLRQRKVVATSELQTKVISQQKQPESLLANRLFQLLLVAILFFFAGKFL